MTAGHDHLRERLNQLFLEEFDERAEDLRMGLDHLAAAGTDPQETAAALEALFRSAHSLKGAAQAMGVAAVATACHHLEDLLTEVREGRIQPGPTLLPNISDAIEQIVAAQQTPVPEGRAKDAATDAPLSGTGADHPSTEGVPGSDLSPFGSVQPSGSMRVAPQKFDALLAQAADLVSAVHRCEQLVQEAAAAKGRISQLDRDRRGDLWILERLARATSDGGRALEALSNLERRHRETTKEHELLVRALGAHGRRLRTEVEAFLGAAEQVGTVPFSDATAGLARMVRELADQTDKQAQLIIDSEDVAVDKPLVAVLHDVLGHLVRNAMGHGLEPPDEREAGGKHHIGTVKVSAVLTGDGIQIEVSDDGRGVAIEDVRRVATTQGLIPDGATQATLEEVLFHPGLTTTTEVSQYSGRGVGLDAVRTQVERMGGTVTLESRSGSGTTVRTTVPLSKATIRVVITRVADSVVAVPSSAVRAVTTMTSGDRRISQGREIVTIDDVTMPLVHLAEMLGWGRPDDPGVDGEQHALVLESGSDMVAVVATAILAEQEVILRPPAQRLRGMATLLGVTQLPDGTVSPVLNPATCVRTALTLRPAGVDEVEPARTPRILLAEDTVTTRELERSILELAGYTVLVATDGAQAWQLLQKHQVHAVVSDIDMPRMDGLALCRAIRASQEHAGLPVVLVTSLHNDDDRARGIDAGADAYLSKSGFDRGELLETLERLL